MTDRSDLEVAKRSLRDRMRRTRPELAPAAREAVGRAIAAALLADPAFLRAPRVALFASDASEPPTRPLFDALARRGVPRLLPRIEEPGLAFAEVQRWDDLVEGRFGILAPAPELPTAALASQDVVIVPGVAFDAQGGRLGRGSGYYDRAFPSDRPGPVLIGAIFTRQVVPEVPHDSRDRAMDAIVTEDGLRWVSRADRAGE
jgi:5-formyltetrahydrofolate cyclo-ligase